jgi:hypothetical protein
MTNAVNIAQSGSNNQTMRNRIINGAMTIDQRNAGAAVTVNTSGDVFSADRWQGSGVTSEGVFTLQQSTTSTPGFVNSLLATVTTVDSSIGASQRYIIRHMIEGLNVGDLAWGTANAQPVTLSFWVRSSLTGTFSGSLENAAANRSYPFSFTISSANTFEYKTVTVPGDTTGTWLTTNGVGIQLNFDMGCGADLRTSANAWAAGNFRGVTGSVQLIANSGATFFITGVQLEEGTAASPFENRLYGTELLLCQRYFQLIANGAENTAAVVGAGMAYSSSEFYYPILFPVVMRATPTFTLTGSLRYYLASSSATSSSVTADNLTLRSVRLLVSGSGATAGNGSWCQLSNSASDRISLSAEL